MKEENSNALEKEEIAELIMNSLIVNDTIKLSKAINLN